MRAVEDQSAPIPEEITSERGRIIYIVRSPQSRIDQAALENEMRKWEDARSGRPLARPQRGRWKSGTRSMPAVKASFAHSSKESWRKLEGRRALQPS